MKEPIFTGSSAAIITPFTSGAPDFAALARIIDYQIENGTSAITVCGTTGEASAMSAKERRDVIEFTVRRVKGRIPVIAGTGCNDTSRAYHYSMDALEAGANAILVVTPYYNKTTQKGLIAHYTYLADRVPLPMILYNVPSRTGMSISAETYEILSRHPNINGTKEASGSIPLLCDVLSRCKDYFYVWSGNDTDTVPFMSLGAKGVISVAANVIPSVMADMANFCLNGNFIAAADLQIRYSNLCSALFREVNPIPVKEALNLLGFRVGTPRLPLVAMSEENRLVLKTALSTSGLIPS